jgi:hypothetical protein
MTAPYDPTKNRLLASLSASDLNILSAHLRPAQLRPRAVLHESWQQPHSEHLSF